MDLKGYTTLAILTLATLMAITIYEVYVANVKIMIDLNPNNIEVIDPTLNVDLLDKLPQRVFSADEQEQPQSQSAFSAPAVTPTPTVTPTPK